MTDERHEPIHPGDDRPDAAAAAGGDLTATAGAMDTTEDTGTEPATAGPSDDDEGEAIRADDVPAVDVLDADAPDGDGPGDDGPGADTAEEAAGADAYDDADDDHAAGRTPVAVAATAADARRADSLLVRIGRALRHPRLTGAGVVIALLVGLLGFALIAQVKSNNNSSTLNNDRPDDLVRILSDLDSRKDRLDSEITGLQTQQQQLSSGAQGQQAALNAATQRADELGILAGTLPAVGPGLVIRMEASSAVAPLSAIVVLETIEELRGAGAEAIEISGTNSPSVRVIASSWIGDGDGGVLVSGVQMQGTLTITAIGDSQTMQTALSIPGGVADTVEGNGGTVLLQQEARVQVTALAPTGTLKYAHPVQ